MPKLVAGTSRSGTRNHDAPEDSRRHRRTRPLSLCLNCRYATIVKGQRLRDEIVECSRLGERVRFPVNSCTGYINRVHPTIREMEDVAWVLRSDPHRNTVNFVKASKLKIGERYVLDEWD